MLTAESVPIARMTRFAGETPRATAILDALLPTLPAATSAPWLVLWGPGGVDRQEPMRRQLAKGGHVIALDLAYWDRDRKFRVSIDAPHPQRWVMRQPWSTDRLRADHPPIANLWNPAGPVLLADIGDKARLQYGWQAVEKWNRHHVAEATARGRRVCYRPKRARATMPGTIQAPLGTIDHVLRGVSLVVTYHSNVAVDAIRCGIPVICQDGAAAAVCPSEWPESGMPSPLAPAVRDQFLANLAWFQWQPDEAREMWAFLKGLVG